MDAKLITVPSLATFTTGCLACRDFENFGLASQKWPSIHDEYILVGEQAPSPSDLWPEHAR